MKLNLDIYISKIFYPQICLNFIRPPCILDLLVQGASFYVGGIDLASGMERSENGNSSTIRVMVELFPFFAIRTISHF